MSALCWICFIICVVLSQVLSLRTWDLKWIRYTHCTLAVIRFHVKKRMRNQYIKIPFIQVLPSSSGTTLPSSPTSSFSVMLELTPTHPPICVPAYSFLLSCAVSYQSLYTPFSYQKPFPPPSALHRRWFQQRYAKLMTSLWQVCQQRLIFACRRAEVLLVLIERTQGKVLTRQDAFISLFLPRGDSFLALAGVFWRSAFTFFFNSFTYLCAVCLVCLCLFFVCMMFLIFLVLVCMILIYIYFFCQV